MPDWRSKRKVSECGWAGGICVGEITGYEKMTENDVFGTTGTTISKIELIAFEFEMSQNCDK